MSGVQLPFNILWSTMFTRDAIDELDDDLLMPEGPCLTFQDLGINPQKVLLLLLLLLPCMISPICCCC